MEKTNSLAPDLAVRLVSEDERYTLKKISDDSGLILAEVSADFGEAVRPAPFSVSFELDMLDVYATWRPAGNRDHGIRQWFSQVTQHADFYCGAPVLSCIANNGDSALTLAVSDSENPVSLYTWVDDLAQKEQMGFRIDFFQGDGKAMTAYRAVIRLDRRRIPFDRALQDTADWWQGFVSRHDPVPDDAEMPLYSSWYSFHQQPDQRILETELAEAEALGFRTLIVDDGWQFDAPNTGDYRFCGDWAVSKVKFPDFRAFTERAHAHGIKVILWFPVPFVGFESKAYEIYRDKLLYRYGDLMKAGVLDVRRPEVRDFIVSTYERFLRDYALDGLKLDFIDSFCLHEESPAYDPQAMDCATVEDAVKTLLGEIVTRCRALKPDFLLEFRQYYIGPSVVSYGNMLRVCDCAFDPIFNRIGVADLRLSTRGTAVHSDMLFWSKKESPENVARQLYNVLFGVPQISVILSEIPSEQKRVLSAFLSRWLANREVLLHGTFRAFGPEANYTRLEAEDAGKKVVALYAENSVIYPGKAEEIFCASGSDVLLLRNPGRIPCRIRVYDCFGEQVREMMVREALVEIPLPPCARCEWIPAEG